MREIDGALAASRQAAEQLIGDAEALGSDWGTPRAPGKWSPSQIVEHIARSLDSTVALAHGQPSSFPSLPVIVHPLLRIIFRRLLNARSWPKGKTTPGMNPEAGPPTPTEGRARLQAAHARYEAACRQLAARGAPIRTPMFGAVPVADFVRSWSSTCATTGGSFLAAPVARSRLPALHAGHRQELERFDGAAWRAEVRVAVEQRLQRLVVGGLQDGVAADGDVAG